MHPGAWWAWAIGVAAAASMTTSPLILALITVAVTAVVLLRRTDSPWARSLGAYAVLAVFIVSVRLFFQVLVGGGMGTTVLVTLPEIALPDWAAGIRLGGPVTAEGLAYATYDALRLATMLLCLGAANALANPRRTLRSVPAALYEMSVAVVIALSVAPQLVESVQRVRRARRLRGGRATGLQAVKAVVLPVLADAIDRSLLLATSMEARGFGRTRGAQGPGLGSRAGLATASLMTVLGAFWVLSAATPALVGVALLVVGVTGTVAGLRRTGRRLAVTHYRPDPWTARDTIVALSGAAAFAVAVAANSPAWPAAFNAFQPSIDPLVWPSLHPSVAALLTLAVAPLAVAPRTTTASRSTA